jgi:hypothetical protein
VQFNVKLLKCRCCQRNIITEAESNHSLTRGTYERTHHPLHPADHPVGRAARCTTRSRTGPQPDGRLPGQTESDRCTEGPVREDLLRHEEEADRGPGETRDRSTGTPPSDRR